MIWGVRFLQEGHGFSYGEAVIRSATVRLNAPYNLGRFDGWVVTMERPGNNAHEVMLTT